MWDLVGKKPPPAARMNREDRRGKQLLIAEGLDQVVVGARIEGEHQIGLTAACGYDDDGDAWSTCTDLATKNQAVHIGQSKIEHNEGNSRTELRQCL